MALREIKQVEIKKRKISYKSNLYEFKLLKKVIGFFAILFLGLGLFACGSISNKEGGSAHIASGETQLNLFGLKDDNSKAKNPKATKPKTSPKSTKKSDTKIKVLPADPEAGIPLTDENVASVMTNPIKIETNAPKVEKLPEIKPQPSPKPTQAPLPFSEKLAENPVLDTLSNLNDLSQEQWQEKIPQLQLAEDLQNKIKELEQEIRDYKNQIKSLQTQVNKQWGEKAPISDAEKFVKYTDNYESREIADFEVGKVVVETLDQNNPKAKLKEALVAALLTPSYAENPNLFNDKNIEYEGPYLLAGQVVDQDGIEVKWPWRANRFADYLIENKLKQSVRDGKKVYSVEFDLVKDHAQVRGRKYETLVRNASIRYKVPETLIYAIMKVESNFNPYATSHIPAYGLMQIVPATAGRDVYKKIKGLNSTPSANQLYNPVHNIDIGTGYLYILERHYLKDIRNPQSREYAVISAYNGGAGNVLKTFHRDRKRAVSVINSLSAQEVYNKLAFRNPSSEARKYLTKVVKAKQEFKVN